MTHHRRTGPAIAIVTGASSGIGQGAARQLAARGAGVIVTYRSRPEGIAETVAAVEAEGGTAVALPLDLARSDSFGEFAGEVARTLEDVWGRSTFDHLVNNAGTSGSVPFAEMTEETFDALLRVNFKGPYFLTQALLPLLADGGAIVNVGSSSTHKLGVTPGYSAYASAKGALEVATRYLAKELGPRGIRVNTVLPGPTRTRLGGDAFALNPEIADYLADRTVLGRVGEPDDIGRVIAALAGDDGAWITGEDITASGGFGL